ncbi:MAG: heme-binding protein [Acetobacteraceae bacterium]|nr:heme-binding protein [Acetobacteraceae bacterium]
MHARLAFALIGISLFAAPAVHAQQAPAAPAAIPDAMPFDIPYGTPITLEQAQKAITAAAAEANKRKWRMSIAVVDPSGNLIAHATLDGTQYASIPISQAKARAAAGLRRPSKVLQDVINSGTPSLLSLLPLFGGAASEGGLPIVVDGKLIGAIGVSGGLSVQDGVIAKAGLDAITTQ